MSSDINVFLTAHYNTSPATGKWFKLPISESQARAELGVVDDVLMVSDYEAPFKLGSYISLPELNKLAVKIEELPEGIKRNIKAIADAMSVDEFLNDFTNATLYPGVKSYSDFADHLFDVTYIDIPQEVISHVNFESFGEDALSDYTPIFTPDGMILNGEW